MAASSRSAADRFAAAWAPAAAMLVLGLTAAALLASTASGRVYPDSPPPAHTGGFGEPTCQECHFDGPLNDPSGTLAIEGVPDVYVPGQRYRLEVVLVRPEMEAGGFELSARFAEGARVGRPAGSIGSVNDRVEVTRQESTGVTYAHQTEVGTALTRPGAARWRVEWIAPDPAGGPVVFHVAGNAGNGDLSAFGDFIYTMSATSRPGAAF